MIQRRTKEWLRMDNAALMFPSASSNKNTRVFRFSCELTDDVEPEPLQRALDKTVEQNPDFVCTVRAGLFWHYLERSREIPSVHQERFTPCYPIYNRNKKRLLFYVSYYRRRINVETYHSLTDGAGAVAFIRMLVIFYLLETHSELCSEVPPPGLDGSVAQRREDSFNKHYTPLSGSARIRMPSALQLKGRVTPDRHYNLIEGAASAGEVLALAHRYNTTVTGLLCGLYMQAIAEGASALEKKRPVVITVPFNLRNIFPSETLRNFFATTNVAYSFSERDGSLEDITQTVTDYLKSDDTKQALIARMYSLVAMQRNIALRIAPLPLKNIVISASKRINERGETAVLSNVSRVELPEPLRKYVSMFMASSATSNMHLCVLTYQDRMAMTFSSAFVENEVARRFFRRLTAEGVAVAVTSNYNQK